MKRDTITLSQSRLEVLCVFRQRAVYLYASPVTVTSTGNMQVGGFLISEVLMKTCTRCGKEKQKSEFHKANREPDGLKYWCKECSLSYNSAYRKRKPRRIHFFRTHELRHQKKTMSSYVAIGRSTNYNLRARYGITLREYNILLDKQNGVCAVCGRGPGKRSLHVDHCHKTGRIRALLCSNCNSTLGKVRDDINILNKLIEYLGKHQNASPTPLT